MDQNQLALYVGIGVIAVIILVVIIVVPRQIRKGKEHAHNATHGLNNAMAAMGLKFNGKFFEGEYKGYYVKLEKGMGKNESAMWDAGMDMLSGSSQVRDLHGRDTFYPIVRVWLDKPGANFPDVTFFHKSNYFLDTDEFWNNRINGRIPDEKKIDVDGSALNKKGSFYGDVEGAKAMVASPELRNLMSTWIYPDLRADGSQIRLELNNRNIQAKWTYKKTTSHEWLVQAVEICVATANALS